MKIIARRCPNCKDVLYSRAHYDFRTCGCGDTSVDGGPGVERTIYKKEIPENVELDVNVTKDQLYDDWNNRINKYGIVKETEKHMEDIRDETNWNLDTEGGEG